MIQDGTPSSSRSACPAIVTTLAEFFTDQVWPLFVEVLASP